MSKLLQEAKVVLQPSVKKQIIELAAADNILGAILSNAAPCLTQQPTLSEIDCSTLNTSFVTNMN